MNDRKSENIKRVCAFLPENISAPVMSMKNESKSRLSEIRIRSSKPVVLVFTDKSMFITESGRLTEFISNDLVTLAHTEIEAVFSAMCRYSVHSLSREIAEGFITVDGGNRVGVYGTAVTDGEKIVSVRDIKGLNIRISGDFIGCAKPVADRIYGGRCVNVLICGPPSSGKTTVLKDLCRILSDEQGRKICLVDERFETGGCDTGINTDILSGYPRIKGIEIAVRTLSPHIIAFDEIGTLSEAEAVSSGLNCGVSFIMTIHCRSKSELVKKPQFRHLKVCGGVDYCVFLEGAGKIAEIITVEELENENCGAERTGTCLRPVGSVHSLRA